MARALKERSLPQDVEVIDAGTCSEVAFDLETAERVIVVDAAHGGRPPGTVYRFTGEEIAFESAEDLRSTHSVDLLHTLRSRSCNGHTPKIVVIGVEPEEIDWGLDLSTEVAAGLSRIVEIVQEELRGCRCS